VEEAMEVLIIFLLAIVLAVVGFALWETRESRRTLETQLLAQRTELMQSLSNAQQSLQQRVDGIDSRLNQSLSSTATTMENIGKQLEGVRGSADRILEVGQSISSLQDILSPPKLRGGFGEMLLERLLAQILPQANYEFQHRFRSGEAVDAVIRLGPSLVPVDAKFPMESLNRVLAATTDEDRTKMRREFVRAVKGHVDTVAKYIRPDEETFDFALMYIPAENVYYESIVKSEADAGAETLQQYALQRRVIPVSPNCLYAYLQAIVLGLRGMRVERQAQQIVQHLQGLQGDFGRFQDGFKVLGGHIRDTTNKYADLERRVATLDHKLSLPLAAEPAEPHQLPAGDNGKVGE
jgi:DNA recombination protein RmuC